MLRLDKNESPRSIVWFMAVIRFVVISLVALAGFNLFKLIFFGQAFESEAQGIGAVIVMCLGAVTIAALETRRWLQKR